MNTGRRIAVIGAGISGLGAAWLLSRKHDVVLYERSHHVGGHALTIIAQSQGREIPVDVGFIVFNRVNYPHFCQLLDHLNVATKMSDMSFAVSVNQGDFEYGGRNLRALFAQRGNMIKPDFWRMFLDIAKFNKWALADSHANPNMTLGEMIRSRHYGSWFQNYYLLPMSGAIWSTPRGEMLNFPFALLARFFDHHGLLTLTGQHQWWTVEGGSENYVTAVLKDLKAKLRTKSPIENVIRTSSGTVEVKVQGHEAETFDQVVFACHTDDINQLLSDASDDERGILDSIPYQRNKVVLHTDPTLMPKRRACWASWVYLAQSQSNEAQASVTYWMNSLQGIPEETPLFVTLNPPRPIREDTILAEHQFDHPQYGFAALKAHSQLAKIQGRAHTWFCGAWTGMGFHEDGLASAVKVAQSLGVSPPWSH